MKRLRRSTWLAAWALAAAGCAQVQPAAVSEPTAVDAQLLKWCGWALGARGPASAASPAPRGKAVELASHEELPPAAPEEPAAGVEPPQGPELPPGEPGSPLGERGTLAGESGLQASGSGAGVSCSTGVASSTCGCCAQCPLAGGSLPRCRCVECLARRVRQRPQPGPPPVSYVPELPPKFLPVPTQPILPPARPGAPEPWRGNVEVPYNGHTLIVPARD